MSLRRILGLGLLLYLTADYCDPSTPGVFFFDSASLFMDGIEAKTSSAIAESPLFPSPPPVRATFEMKTTLRRSTPVRALSVRVPYSPRMYLAGSRPRSPVGSAEDH